MVNNDREKDSIEVEATNYHKAMLEGEQEYCRRGWHAEDAKRIYHEETKRRTLLQ